MGKKARKGNHSQQKTETVDALSETVNTTEEATQTTPGLLLQTSSSSINSPSQITAAPSAVQKFKPSVTLSFSAGGWFQVYHYGVALALQEMNFFDEYNVRLCGSSAGSLAATALAGEADFNDMCKFACECAEHCRLHYWHVFKMKDYLLASIHRFAKGPMSPENLPKVMQNCKEFKVEVYATKLPSLEAAVLKNFSTFEDVKEALCASCCFTPFVGFPFQMSKTKEWVMDGGVRNFQPRHDEKETISINPFYFTTADIKPSTTLPVWWALFPPPKDQYQNVFDIGYNDCILYMVKNKLVDPDMIRLCKKLPEDLIPRRGPLTLMRDLFLACLYLFTRPLAVVLIYAELFVIAVVTLLHALLWTMGPSRWHDVYSNARNIISARTFFKLWFFAAMPFNELRLSKSSLLFRFFNPIFFETKKSKVHRSNRYARWAERHEQKVRDPYSPISLDSEGDDEDVSEIGSTRTTTTPTTSTCRGIYDEDETRSTSSSSNSPFPLHKSPSSPLVDSLRRQGLAIKKILATTFHLPKLKSSSNSPKRSSVQASGKEGGEVPE